MEKAITICKKNVKMKIVQQQPKMAKKKSQNKDIPLHRIRIYHNLRIKLKRK